MKIKKEYVILFLIIVVLVLYITLRKESRIQYEIPEVTELSPDSILGIVINGNSNEILLTRENGKWLVGADKYIADAYKVEKMINFLKRPVLTTVVSDSKDYLRYGLDEKNRITVKAVLGETPQRVVEIGYSTDARNYTFIKLENDDRIYHAKEDLRDIFSTDIDDLRDKTVLSFNIEKSENVSLKKDGKEFIFNKKAIPAESGGDKPAVIQWETADGKVVDQASMNSLLGDIMKVKCSKYLYDIKKDESGEPAYVIRVKDEGEHTLTVFPKKGDDYTAVSSDNPTAFSMYSWKIDNIIKKFDKMAGTEDEKVSGTE